jgi:GT2 family glycosyltransferase
VTQSLSVLIVNWNAWTHLRRCLEALHAAEDADFEILVIDNASTDGSVEQVRRLFPRVRVQANPTNQGGPRALNQALGLVRSTYILRLDADTEIQRESIALLRNFLDERQDVAVVAPRTYNTDGSVQETARNFPSVLSGIFGRQSQLTRLFPNNPISRRYLARDYLGATEPFQVEQVSAACVMLRRSLVEEIGPWDEGYPPAYWDDTDWCLRLRKHGKKIFCIPEARVIHHEKNQTNRKRSANRIWMFHRGAFRLYRKHYTLGRFDPRLPVAFGLLTFRAVAMIIYNYFLPDVKDKPPQAPSLLEPSLVEERAC